MVATMSHLTATMSDWTHNNALSVAFTYALITKALKEFQGWESEDLISPSDHSLPSLKEGESPPESYLSRMLLFIVLTMSMCDL